MEGYCNIDSGTLNPYRHGEVFVLDDGMETDMDLGTYERLLDQDMSAANFTTNGQIMSSVLRKEREGSYLGRDVQYIPHVTGEVKLKLRELAAKSNADVIFVEVGWHRWRFGKHRLPGSVPTAGLRRRGKFSLLCRPDLCAGTRARWASRNPKLRSWGSSG